MEILPSKGKRNLSIHWRTRKSRKTVVHQTDPCHPLAGVKGGTILTLPASIVRGLGLVRRGPGDLRSPGSVGRCFSPLRLMTGRPTMAIELGIWGNGPDTKSDFHRCPHRMRGFTARNRCVGGSPGKVSTEEGDMGPGLRPSQRVRSGLTTTIQVTKDHLKILTSYLWVYVISIFVDLSFEFV